MYIIVFSFFIDMVEEIIAIIFYEYNLFLILKLILKKKTRERYKSYP